VVLYHGANFNAEHNKHIQDMPGKLTIFPLVATHHPWNEIPEFVRRLLNEYTEIKAH
jgi:hypothetical protein